MPITTSTNTRKEKVLKEEIQKGDIERIFTGFALEAQKQLTASFKKQKKKVIVLAGPTAIGKSVLAMALAKKIGGEIIVADSVQVYHGLDIGTAKPSISDRLEIPHHLVDIRDLDESFNVVDFYYEARMSCQKTLNRDNVPIVVGGTGFYLHALLFGPPNGPPPVPELRKTLFDECERLGASALLERLKKLDPIYANSITKNDTQKIIRALEIITLTGKTVSELSWKNRRVAKTYDFRCWFLHRPKGDLYKRIEDRCDFMLLEGFLEEVKSLMDKGLKNNVSASQAIGYRQAIEFFNTPQSKDDYAHFVTSFKQASRHYAKRQLTWFRKEPLFRWLDLSQQSMEEALNVILKDYDLDVSE